MTSTNRTRQDAGWVNVKRLPKGPNGRSLCRQCGVEVPKGRRSFCSDGCVHEWRIRSDPAYARELVKRRDNGVCAACGRDCEALRRELWRQWHDAHNNLQLFREARQRIQQLNAEGFSLHEGDGGYDGKFWQADHIVPVAEGGGECDLSNLRTLCTPCHKQATKALRARMKQARQQSTQLELINDTNH